DGPATIRDETPGKLPGMSGEIFAGSEAVFPTSLFEGNHSMMTKRRLLPGLLAGLLATVAAPAWAGETNKYLPDATEGVVTVNVRQMLDAPLVKNNLDTLKALLLATGNVQKVFDDLGFDPFTDIDRVTVAINEVPTKSLVLVQGKFDPAKITAKAEK